MSVRESLRKNGEVIFSVTGMSSKDTAKQFKRLPEHLQNEVRLLLYERLFLFEELQRDKFKGTNILVLPLSGKQAKTESQDE